MNRNDGYIAIVSSLIIGGFVILAVVALGFGAFITRGTIANSYNKEISFSLAEGCIDHALLSLAEDSNYGGNEEVSVGSEKCNVLPLAVFGSSTIISASGEFKNAFTNLKITVTTGVLEIEKWEEMVSF